MKRKIILTAFLLVLIFGTACSRLSEEPVSEGQNKYKVVEIGKMSVERAAHQATLLKSGQVLITGGCAGNGCDLYLGSVEFFDPATQTFQPAPPMSTPRAGHVAVALLDGRVLVCGGWTGQGAADSAEIFDPATGQWTAAGNMSDARESLMAVPLLDGRVLIAGGSGGLDDLASAEIFDPATSTFSAVGSMGSNHYLATALADGRVLLTGGTNKADAILRSAEIFDPTTGEFQPTGDMETPRVKHAGALLPDGKILIAGGSDTHGFDSRFKSTEIYDPVTGEFSPGPPMQWARHKIRDSIIALPSGDILISGGATRMELYDSTDQVFIPVEGELSGTQMFPTATLLPSGDVLVLGGYDERTWSSATAWLVHTKD